MWMVVLVEPLYTWVSVTVAIPAPQSCTRPGTAPRALHSYPGRDLLLCSVFDCCRNKLSAFPSTIISSEVIWLIWLKLRELRYTLTAEGYNCVLQLWLTEGNASCHQQRYFLEVSIMKNAGGFCISTNPTQKVTRVKLLFNLQNADWRPGIGHLLSMFQRLRKNNQHWPKRAEGGALPSCAGKACQSVSTPQKSLTRL